MNAVQIVIFALCIYQISALSYEETIAHCRNQAKINDKVIDHFFEHASWPKENTDAGCYFNCMGKHVDSVDEAGVPIKSKLTKVASEHRDVGELQILASDASFNACTSQATGPTPCAATENFVICAVKNAKSSKQN